MKRLLKSKTFIGAFLVTYFSFFVLTMYVFEVKTSSFGAGSWDYGFPFTYFFERCFNAGYIWSGLFGNIVFAGILSFAVGAIAAYFRQNHLKPFLQRVSSKEFRAKWHIKTFNDRQK